MAMLHSRVDTTAGGRDFLVNVISMMSGTRSEQGASIGMRSS
jgi:hypothetical protein